MHPIIYDVAVSLDGFISGLDGDISQFAHEGEVVDDYLQRLAGYHSAIMGRATYEFGYQYGLKAGQNPYPHMQTYVVSQTLDCPEGADITVIRGPLDAEIRHLRQASSGPIYLCGGGAFAGSMLARGHIDQICLKRAPIVLGVGVKLFDQTQDRLAFRRTETKMYDNGYLLERFDDLNA